MGKNIIVDNSYNIKEIEVDNSWMKDLSSADYLEYRKKWELASRHHHLFDFPLFLEVETSYACNYKCPKCPRQTLPRTEGRGFLSSGLLDKLFEEVKQYRMPSITFSHGGEPLMRKDLPLLIRKAKESLILDRMFHTNGFLLTKELSVQLIESGLTKINFSLDAASQDVYKKVRIGGDYETVISNIQDFLEIKKSFGKSYPRIRISFVISEENKHQQRKFYELWKDKVNVIAFQKCYDFSKMRDIESTDFRKLSKKSYFCSQLWQLLTITCEGNIIVCERDYDHRYVLGNLKTHTIHECWHSGTINRFRQLHLENQWYEIPLCRKCVTSIEYVQRDEVSQVREN